MYLLVNAIPRPVCIKSASIQERELWNFVVSFVFMGLSQKR